VGGESRDDAEVRDLLDNTWAMAGIAAVVIVLVVVAVWVLT
jgi:heme/copper-type cytochrome/quinol oxidase subunit 2